MGAPDGCIMPLVFIMNIKVKHQSHAPNQTVTKTIQYTNYDTTFNTFVTTLVT